ncbi:MAG: DUF2292 domain-containing protein [Enterococcus hirae]|nr:DUF2292 domain-containing protein [Enterococcus hirae]MBO1087596.1 DUF2292 domain-containing protein [Enterococcus hirae]MCC1498809.1 DUF2292 domain-containing protein [Enterococcus hirae]MCD5235020.1 DUF2292 domain-containing protein [Enterococcus hirae]MCI5922986.1 DUF2292 domain-containing protein [Enterococcus hirae]MDY5309784.1 DUF2292 domain-containing protein [Enterococcus hirae]
MDKVYIDTANKNMTVDLPQHGEIRMIIQDGRVIRIITETSQKIR